MDEEEQAYIACNRWDEWHSGDSTLDRCEFCKTDVWITPEGRDLVFRMNAKIGCVVCVFERGTDLHHDPKMFQVLVDKFGVAEAHRMMAIGSEMFRRVKIRRN